VQSMLSYCLLILFILSHILFLLVFVLLMILDLCSVFFLVCIRSVSCSRLWVRAPVESSCSRSWVRAPVESSCSRSWVKAPVESNQVYIIGVCCFSTNHAQLRSKSKDWLARNQNNVFEWRDMSNHGLFNKLALSKSNSACWSGIKRTSSSYSHQKCNYVFSPRYSRNVTELALNNNHSLVKHQQS
jgi:hypothetical protein